jgi:hypothetical protein
MNANQTISKAIVMEMRLKESNNLDLARTLEHERMVLQSTLTGSVQADAVGRQMRETQRVMEMYAPYVA